MITYHGCVLTVCVGVMAIVCSSYLVMIGVRVKIEKKVDTMEMKYSKYNPLSYRAYLRQVPHFTNGYVSNDTAEFVWIVSPLFVLGSLCLPSLCLLYFMGSSDYDALFTLQVVGAQWFWTYTVYGIVDNVLASRCYTSYMLPSSSMSFEAYLSNMEVDNRCVIPYNTWGRLIFTGKDVIHSWFVPSLGVKADCVPGRLGMISIFVKTPGVFYGNCAEMCGSYHSMMPIVVESVPYDEFVKFLKVANLPVPDLDHITTPPLSDGGDEPITKPSDSEDNTTLPLGDGGGDTTTKASDLEGDTTPSLGGGEGGTTTKASDLEGNTTPSLGGGEGEAITKTPDLEDNTTPPLEGGVSEVISANPEGDTSPPFGSGESSVITDASYSEDYTTPSLEGGGSEVNLNISDSEGDTPPSLEGSGSKANLNVPDPEDNTTPSFEVGEKEILPELENPKDGITPFFVDDEEEDSLAHEDPTDFINPPFVDDESEDSAAYSDVEDNMQKHIPFSQISLSKTSNFKFEIGVSPPFVCVSIQISNLIYSIYNSKCVPCNNYCCHLVDSKTKMQFLDSLH